MDDFRTTPCKKIHTYAGNGTTDLKTITMNENEILEVEMELGGGDKVQMKIQESDDWSEIEAGTKALLVLVNGQQMLVEINEADEDEGVSFKIIGDNRSYHFDGNVVASIFVEVN